ncbi:MAG: hypothetical protein ACYC5J_13070 [Chloroflexota bacterium]
MRRRRAALLLLVPSILAAVLMGMVALPLPAIEGPARGPDAPTVLPTPIPLDPQAERLTRRDGGEGGAGVSATWLTPEYLRDHPEEAPGLDPQRYLVFRVVVDSQALANTSAWDLKGMIFLREEGGREYGTPVWRPVADGVRKVGMAAFPRRNARDNPVPSPRSRHFEMVIRDLAGVRERVLRWSVPP